MLQGDQITASFMHNHAGSVCQVYMQNIINHCKIEEM